MAALYWMADVKKINRYAWLFVAVGTNAFFIYLFFETLGHQWLNRTVAVFTDGVTGPFGMPDKMQSVVAALVTLSLKWYLCYWRYKRKIFFKL